MISSVWASKIALWNIEECAVYVCAVEIIIELLYSSYINGCLFVSGGGIA
jgi:hypothetical protein